MATTSVLTSTGCVMVTWTVMTGQMRAMKSVTNLTAPQKNSGGYGCCCSVVWNNVYEILFEKVPGKIVHGIICLVI